MKFLDKRHDILIDIQTPSCVLTEIAFSLKIKVNELRLVTDHEYHVQALRAVRQAKPYELSDEYTDDDLSHIALFVNPNENEWDLDELLEAFTWIESIMKSPRLVRTGALGYPIPSKPRSSSAVYVYRYLTSKGLKLSLRSTESEMFELLSNFDLQRDYLFNSALCHFSSLTRKEIAAFRQMIINTQRVAKPLKWSQVRDNVIDLKNGRFSSLHPTSNEAAVAITAVRLNKDISSFKFPIAVYWELIQGLFPTSSYSKDLLEANETIYDFDKNFNPNFPIEAYSDQSLRKLCIDLGILYYTKMSRNYEQLISYHIANNFHHGLKVGVSLESPILLADLSSTPSAEIITFGSFESRFTSYTVEELTSTFQTNEYFYDLYDGICSSESIAQLEVMCRKMIRKRPWKQLLETISIVKKKMNDLKFHKDEFVSWYNSLADVEQKQAKDLLYEVLHLGLRFRNWLPGKKWPVSEVPGYDSNEVAFITAPNVEEVVSSLSRSDHISQKISSLRLIYVEAITHSLLVVNLHNEGLNVLQRLKIVQERNHYQSCIRLTSTRLIATSYTFLSAIKAELEQEDEFQKIEITI